ncbi:hypothetical protein IGI04_017852 [Brassica rapa subsp. trilocularis]|uniref:Uncharacterized protein n=1 Tax=Brassica rapa subsp. trilocularis TaxID=1813537 RepID=A0ABQ7MB88_BRACM|nr:hypothetical protein IGI04_036992 [Brassica rapa subsp. trilocularis]KAG5396038.1 hypothetical protein IGI04_017852 [Brassica rapa subsp. trilocularis]
MREARPVPRRASTVESRPINPDQSLLNAAVFVESFTALLTCEGKPKGGRCRNTVEVRLLKFWEDRNVMKRGELMGVDMLIFA